MKIQTHEAGNSQIAEVIADGIIIRNAEDALDLMGNVYYQGFDKIILHEQNLTPDFFDLKNKMAGEILQKFSNYRVRLAIVGDFSAITSDSLKSFIHESNRGKHVNFVASLAEALGSLTR